MGERLSGEREQGGGERVSGYSLINFNGWPFEGKFRFETEGLRLGLSPLPPPPKFIVGSMYRIVYTMLMHLLYQEQKGKLFFRLVVVVGTYILHLLIALSKQPRRSRYFTCHKCNGKGNFTLSYTGLLHHFERK